MFGLLAVIDFEQQQHIEYITSDSHGTSKFNRERAFHKNGEYGLHLEWSARSIGDTKKVELVLNLARRKASRGKDEMKRGGIKFWMYRKRDEAPTKMAIVFGGDDISGSPAESTETVVNLDFQGWRSVWISYKEFPENQFKLNVVKNVTFKVESSASGSLCLDMIEFLKKVAKWLSQPEIWWSQKLVSPKEIQSILT